jgi:hypothetical protein
VCLEENLQNFVVTNGYLYCPLQRVDVKLEMILFAYFGFFVGLFYVLVLILVLFSFILPFTLLVII